jgi:hypothetical protein
MPGAHSALLGWGASLVIYAIFSGIVFVLHGNEPSLMIDHLAYLRQADDILRRHPQGDYWKSLTQIHSYGVVLAYVHGLTGSHIASLKLLLAVMTVLSLLSFEWLMSLVCDAKWKAVLFTLISGFFVSFGASFWGYTDFAASVQRTAMIPIVLLVVRFWLANGQHPARFVVFPLLVAASIFHLSAYYLVVVLGLLEGWDWAVRRRARLDRALVWFAVALGFSYFVKLVMEKAGVAFTANIDKLVVPGSGAMLGAEEAWRIELLAFPWRNMPLPLPSVAMIAMSYGVILLVAAIGVVAAYRQGFTSLDRKMLGFCAAVAAFSYGPQTLLWVLRQFLSIYPFGLEEVRAINLIMIPSLYFGYRLFDMLWTGSRASAPGEQRALATLVLLLLLAQPLALLRLLPEAGRSWILDVAASSGLIRQGDSLRLLYARQVLGLDYGGSRFYYSALGVLGWLRENAAPETRVVSTLNELILADVDAVGPFNGFLGKAIASDERKVWADSMAEVDMAIASRDIERVKAVARKHRATLAVVPWPVPNALYRDPHYSIIRVGA